MSAYSRVHRTVRATTESPTTHIHMQGKGEFVRGRSNFRDWIGSDMYPAIPNRYHVYIGINCPWYEDFGTFPVHN
jgi:glutathionyl-hydroquinone reductase